MPIETQILQYGGRLWIVRGVLSGKELIARNEAVLDTKSYEGVRWLIIDESEVTSVDLSTEEIRMITQQNDRLAAVLPEMVTAIVIPYDLGLGIARLWEIQSERKGWSTRILQSRADAELWVRHEVWQKFGMELPKELTLP